MPVVYHLLLSRSYALLRTLDNLWSQALSSLSEADQKELDLDTKIQDETFDGVQQIITAQLQTKEDSSAVIYSRKGKPVTFRVALQNILHWLDNFKKVGDIVVQYDPGHAALPWAAFRFVLQAAVTEQAIKGAVLEGLEHISETIARFAWIETLYLHASTALRNQLQAAIVKLYVLVLEFLAYVKHRSSRHTYQKVLKSIVSLDNQKVEKLIKKLSTEEEKVIKIAHLIDTQYQQEHAKVVEGGITSLLAKVEGLSLQIEDLNRDSSDGQRLPSQKRDDFLAWMAATSTHQDLLNALEAKEEGTCDWITSCPAVQEWLVAQASLRQPSILWIYGRPGAGKTILSTRLTQYLQQKHSTNVAYFFCYYGHEKKCQYLAIVKSWITQILKFCATAWDTVASTFQDKETNFAEPYEVWHMFRRVCKEVPGCYLLVDGFDECRQVKELARQHSTLDAKRQFLNSLDDAIRDTSVRVFFMSRFDPDLKDYMDTPSNLSSGVSTIRLQYEITKEDTASDLIRFAENKTNTRLAGRDPVLINQLIQDSVEKANGMFLWIKLAHNRLSRSESPSNLRTIIENQPAGLDEAYERDMQNILNLYPDRRQRAIEILRLTLYTYRPLTVRQLLEALLVDLDNIPPNLEETPTSSDDDSLGEYSNSDDSQPSENSSPDENETSNLFPRDRLPDTLDRSYAESEVLKLCGSFIELRRSDDSSDVKDETIHFVHFSMCEYLQKTSIFKFPQLEQYQLSDIYHSHDRIVQICLRYLCYDDFFQNRNSSLPAYEQKLDAYPFLNYAAVSWGHHIGKCRPLSRSVIQLSNTLLNPANAKWLSFSEVIGANANGGYESFITRFREAYPSPLFYASLWGVTETMEYLMARGENVNHNGGLYGNPLNAAAAHGNLEAVQLLLERQADIDAVGGMLGTALASSSYQGQTSVVSLLLREKADLEKSGGWFNHTPIIAASRVASRKVSEEVTRLLVKAGADLNSTDDGEKTALHHASADGKTNVARYLIRHDASLNLQDRDGMTPLADAIVNGQHKAAKCLVQAGADPNIRNEQGYTAVHHAASNGQLDLLRAMVGQQHNPPDFEARADEDEVTPLDIAREGNHEGVVEFLESLEDDGHGE